MEMLVTNTNNLFDICLLQKMLKII